MLNGELIEHLKQFPMDATVVCVFLSCSEYVIMDAEDVRFHKDVVTGPFGEEFRYVMRNGQVMRYDEETWDPNEVPQFLSIIAFPGN